jgi:hypothetical protein
MSPWEMDVPLDVWNFSDGPSLIYSFPRSAWECSLRRSASVFWLPTCRTKRTQSVQDCIPTQSVGTSSFGSRIDCYTLGGHHPLVWAGGP